LAHSQRFSQRTRSLTPQKTETRSHRISDAPFSDLFESSQSDPLRFAVRQSRSSPMLPPNGDRRLFSNRGFFFSAFLDRPTPNPYPITFGGLRWRRVSHCYPTPFGLPPPPPRRRFFLPSVDTFLTVFLAFLGNEPYYLLSSILCIFELFFFWSSDRLATTLAPLPLRPFVICFEILLSDRVNRQPRYCARCQRKLFSNSYLPEFYPFAPALFYSSFRYVVGIVCLVQPITFPSRLDFYCL